MGGRRSEHHMAVIEAALIAVLLLIILLLLMRLRRVHELGVDDFTGVDDRLGVILAGDCSRVGRSRTAMSRKSPSSSG